MKTVMNPTSEALRIVSEDGAHVTIIGAGKTRSLMDGFFVPACAAGCVPAGDSEAEDNPATEVDESRVIMLESVINAVLDEGDESLLTMDGCPKANELKKRFGSHTADEREAAWENVKNTRDRD